MSHRHSLRRRAKYILSAIFAPAGAGIVAVDFHKWQQIAGFLLTLISVAIVASRAYSDTTVTKITTP